MGALLTQLYEIEQEYMSHPDLDRLRSELGKLFPSYLLQGPYHLNTKIGLLLLYGGMLVSRLELRKNPTELDLASGRMVPLGPSATTWLRFVGMCYGWSVLLTMFKDIGYHPLATYTIISWTLTTLRYTFGVLSKMFSPGGVFEKLDEILRFPALVQNTVTFAVWWLILVPVLMLSLPAGKARQSFHEWNTSYFLLTVHGFNLPFAVMDHLLVPRKLKYYDLWLGLAIAVSYLAFYLRFLDRYGIQLYIILSPRTAFSPVVMIGLLSIYYGLWKGYNHLADMLLQSHKIK